MADETLDFTPETVPTLSQFLVGFRSPTVDQERVYQLQVLFAFFNGIGGFPRPTHLLGGTSSALDGLAAALLAALPDDYVIELFMPGQIVARFRLRAIDTDVEDAPWLVVCDNNLARLWELISVSKEAVPCTWNPDTSKWHQQLGSGTGDVVAPALAAEDDAFVLPL